MKSDIEIVHLAGMNNSRIAILSVASRRCTVGGVGEKREERRWADLIGPMPSRSCAKTSSDFPRNFQTSSLPCNQSINQPTLQYACGNVCSPTQPKTTVQLITYSKLQLLLLRQRLPSRCRPPPCPATISIQERHNGSRSCQPYDSHLYVPCHPLR